MGASMRRSLVLASAALLALAMFAGTSAGRDRPFGTTRLIYFQRVPHRPGFFNLPGTGGGQFSKAQIEAFRCESSGDPSTYVDLSCNATRYGQDFAPDNEIAIAADPEDPDHLLAGSNDYFYRFNNATGARQALVPTGARPGSTARSRCAPATALGTRSRASTRSTTSP
jgi:hypothetical protein